MKHSIVLGCGRSGTSIFGEFFEDLKVYEYHSEPDFESLLDFDYKKPIAIKVPKESPGFSPDNGLSFPLKKILNTIPEPRQFFWIVRHPLDAICSLKVGIAKNWGHHPQPPDWRDWLSEPLACQCAHHWNYLNTIGFQKVKHLVKVKYFEDMIAEPKIFATQIVAEVGLNRQTCGEAIDYWSERVQDSNNKKFVEAKTSRGYSTTNHKVRIGRWKENLTKEEFEMVLPLVKDTASFFGYQL